MTFLFVTNCYYNSSGGAEINGENAICLYSANITHNQGNARTVFDILCVKLQLQCYIAILFKINKMLYLNLFIKILCFPSLNYNFFFGFADFMYTDSSFGDPGDTTELLFPEFVTPPGNYLSFYYYMQGRDIGTLQVS